MCRGVEGEAAAALQQLLLGSVAAQQPEAVRMAALQWSIKLFPFAHIPARYLCILAAADPRFQIAEAAVEALQPGKFASGAQRAAGPGKSGGDTAGGGGGPAYPAFAEVLQYLRDRVPQLGRRPADGGAPALHPKVSPWGGSARLLAAEVASSTRTDRVP